jgi:hypothetical protein
MKKLMIGALLLVFVSGAMASGTDVADPQTVVTTATEIAASVTVLALGLLGWAVGSRLVRRYIK